MEEQKTAMVEEDEEGEQSDPIDDALWFARTGELEELKQALTLTKLENCKDAQSGSTPLHMASANGHVSCVEYLLSIGADQTVKNSSGSTALHWAVQNGHTPVVSLLCSKPGADVLLRNAQGKGSTTLAIEKGNSDMVKILLEHPTAAELEAKKDAEGDEVAADAAAATGEQGNDDRSSDEQIHDSVFYFIKSPDEPTPSFTIREVGIRPKTLEELAQGDATRTHYTVWAASVILARWVTRDVVPGQSIMELGAGCGLAGVAAHRCCKPSKVMLTDLEVNDHLQYNIRTSRKKMIKSAKAKGKDASAIAPIAAMALDWTEESTYPSDWVGNTDVLIGSDLVYDVDLVHALVDACTKLAKPKTGKFLYVTAATDRAGIDEFLRLMKESFVLESQSRAPAEFLKNPLGEDKQELFELHLSELRDVDHYMYCFRRM
jgi:ankyrin repeat protein